MHGDEPTATAALFDVLHYIQANRTAPHVAQILDRLTLHVVPMLNPDGAERPQRRNAQGIDINRDALLLQTPEGRALKALRDRINPPIGFNLHNQNWRTSVGRTGKPAAMSLLAVSFDEARSDNPGRIRAKKVASVIRDAMEPLAPGMIGRYEDDFEVRAFGDNLTKWGTSVVLIETGPYPGPDPDRALVRMNFVALLTSLDALASGRVDRRRPRAVRDAAVQRLDAAAHADRRRHASRPARASRRFWATSASPGRGSFATGTARDRSGSRRRSRNWATCVSSARSKPSTRRA